MWLNLAKISPKLLAILRAQPALTGKLFYETDDTDPLDGFDQDRDVLGVDYRILSAIAEAAEEANPGFTEERSWLSYAVQGTDDTLDVEFGYGPAYVLAPMEVERLAAGMAEDSEGVVAEPGGTGTGEEPDADADADAGAGAGAGEENEDDEDIGSFYAAAAREGRAIVMAIT
ncbi:hypothetical protein GCM10027290_18600 [Micromonospora sonneratiae]